MSDPDIGQQILKQLRFLRIATVVLAVTLIAVVIYLFVSLKNTNDALCTLRGDLEARAAQTRNYLDEHPNGFPGIPAAALRKNLADQERTIEALSSLNCPPISAS